MALLRRDLLKLCSAGLAGSASAAFALAAPHATSASSPSKTGFLNIRDFGAVGDGSTIDTPAVNRAIDSASSSGGGTVYFPAGTYACYSIRLKSNVSIYLDAGATILAASVPPEGTTSGEYDAAEPNPEAGDYQDFGHSHWHNSLIWGEGLHDIAITGLGLIWGKGLSPGDERPPHAELPGMGNKAIALKNCRNVLLRDFSILKGGHFGLLVTGVDNLTVDNVKIDTDRDGMDIDCCRNVRISNCSVNSPWDDGICPKSSYALGYARATENLTISNCYVTGSYELGSMLDGTWKRFPAGSKVPRKGRIKLGTESNGGFKNVTVSNCVVDGGRGIALESVDGALLEDVTFTGITLRDCTNSPIFLRLGSRLRGPAPETKTGTLKRILFDNIVSYNSASPLPSIISGVPGYPIEDIKLSNLYLHYQGGGTPEMAALHPEEREAKYPDNAMFGALPAYGFFVRHVKNIEFNNVEITCGGKEPRPAFWMNEVQSVDFFRLKAQRDGEGPVFHLQDVKDMRVMASRGLKDIYLEKVEKQQM